MSESKKEIKFKPWIKDYSPAECEFALYETKGKLTWSVIPIQVMDAGYYKTGERIFSWTDVMELNSFTNSKEDNKNAQERMEEFLSKGYKFSYRLSEMISEINVGTVYWIH